MNSGLGRFIYKILLFFLPLFFLVGYIEYKLQNISNIYNTKHDYFEKQKKNIDVLILGNSQAFLGVNPEYLSCKAFNLAHFAQSLHYDKKLTEMHLNEMPDLKYVLIEMSYFSLWYQVNKSPFHWRDYYYYHFWNTPLGRKDFLDIRTFSYTALYNINNVKIFAKNKFKTKYMEGGDIAPNGWYYYSFPKSKAPNVLTELDGIFKISYNNQMIKPELLKDNIKLLSNFINELQKKNIQVILFSTPVHYNYSKLFKNQIQKKNQMVIDSICHKFNLKYLDYTYDKRFTTNEFFDCDHLNTEGASKFTLLLNEDIKFENCKK